MRRMMIMAGLFMAGSGLGGEPNTGSLAERLLAESGKIRTVRCEIRRELEAGGNVMQTLSRVWYERPDKLRVETVTPEARRIVADGTSIYKWIEGQTNGVRILIAGAPEGELIQVRKVPGTADEHLSRLRGVPESELPAEEGFPVRRAYTPQAPHPYTVLSLDAMGRLARLEFFDPANHANRLLMVEYGGWKEGKPGIWIATLQKTEARGRDGTRVLETLRVSNLAVNEPFDPMEFDAARRVPGVIFLSPLEAEAIQKK
jgi:hypothetical protein